MPFWRADVAFPDWGIGMAEVFSSVFSSIDALIYRCRNDAEYTMEYMEGSVDSLVGYGKDDVLQNSVVSWVSLVCKEDEQAMVADVDKAIAENRPWDVFYRLHHKNGSLIPVREQGRAIFENGELVYLEGLVAKAEAENALVMKMEAMLQHTTEVNRDIVGLTSEITKSLKLLHMLSMNARIEAARTGEAGRGFAIVANEIKQLANENSLLLDQIQEKANEESQADMAAAGAIASAGS